jgi:hypothetical protein
MPQNLLIIFAILLIIGNAPSNHEADCLNSSGKWIKEYNECEFIKKAWCDARGGTFIECASACRHAPKSQMCITLCVPVCKLK